MRESLGEHQTALFLENAPVVSGIDEKQAKSGCSSYRTLSRLTFGEWSAQSARVPEFLLFRYSSLMKVG